MGRLTAVVIAVAAVVAALTTALVLSRSSTHKTRGTTAARDAGLSVRVADTRLGNILVDGEGHTLYLYVKDRETKSACRGSCAKVWPPAIVSGTPRAGPGVAADKLTTTRRPDHRRQIVYNGHPLYTLTADVRPGDINGEGFLGTWYVISATGRRIGKLNPSSSSGY